MISSAYKGLLRKRHGSKRIASVLDRGAGEELFAGGGEALPDATGHQHVHTKAGRVGGRAGVREGIARGVAHERREVVAGITGAHTESAGRGQARAHGIAGPRSGEALDGSQ